MKYIQLLLKYTGSIFLQQTLKQIQKNPIYFYIIYVSALDQISKEHSRNLSRWLLEVFPFD